MSYRVTGTWCLIISELISNHYSSGFVHFQASSLMFLQHTGHNHAHSLCVCWSLCLKWSSHLTSWLTSSLLHVCVLISITFSVRTSPSTPHKTAASSPKLAIIPFHYVFLYRIWTIWYNKCSTDCQSLPLECKHHRGRNFELFCLVLCPWNCARHIVSNHYIIVRLMNSKLF